MWTFDKDFGKWLSKDDKLTKDTFDIYKQELSSVRFYSKCLSGATYLPINNLDNIYDILSKYTPRNWYISLLGSQYSNTSIPIDNPVAITKDNSDDYYDKYIKEYGLTLKNKFTPERLIKESINNFITVDVATTQSIDIINAPNYIDGIRLIEGHRVLVKNQLSNTVLPVATDPNTVFEGNFKIVENFGSTIEYEFFNDENGIYLYTNNSLVKQDDLDDYDRTVRFSVSVKLGIVNKDKQFHLSRLKSGYYPVVGEPYEFIENKNWLLRNQVDYNNLFDIDLYDVLKHGTQSYQFEGFTYTIPERTISVGEFGLIINNQSGVSNIINNKYKVNLRSISETSSFYWIVGDNGVILKVRKHDFNVERVEADCNCPSKIIITNLKSVDFFNELNGVVVGDINTILITSDGGLNWERIKIDAFDSYYFNKVVYAKSNRFFIGGNNGIFLDFRRDLSGWTAYRRRVSKFEDQEDDYILVDNINDLIYVEIDSWNPSYSYSTQSTLNNKELVFLVTNDSKVIVHDTNQSIPFETQFFYLNFDQNYGDIVNITRRDGTNDFLFTATGEFGDGGIFKFDLNDFDLIGIEDPISNSIITSSTQSVDPQLTSSLYTNRLFDYNNEIIISGNNSIFMSSGYTDPLDFSDLDPNFDSRLKSKMLFLDYDIASKLNFFTDEGNYRLPIPVEFGYVNADITFRTITIGGQPQLNWFTYWQDRQMTFEYYSNTPMIENKKVLISPTFSYSTQSGGESIMGSIGLTNSLSAIQNLAPTIGDSSGSRFFGTQSITAPSASYSIYLYDYLMIYKPLNNLYQVKIGDVLRFESDIITSNFIVNKIVEIGGSKYIYMFTEFNKNIITELVNQTITIQNLNSFNSALNFSERFENHPLSIGYSLEKTGNTFSVSANFNNLTAYYNMSTIIRVDFSTFYMNYKNSFLKFGYTPTYNILDYLSSIDPVFTGNKEYLVMPDYRDIPIYNSVNNIELIDNLNNDDIFIDNNKIYFGEDLKFEWESIFINTFVDIILYDNQPQTYNNEKLLVNKKYKIGNIFVIEFHKEISFGNNTLTSIDIISRRKLEQISEDLQELNNIQRSLKTKSYQNDNYPNDVEFLTYEKELNFKISTDSYAKILLSDLITNESITALVYIDDKNELSMNITRIDNERSIKIQNTGNSNGDLLIVCDGSHDLSDGDGVILEFTGGTGSSQQLNPQYFGFKTVTVVNDNNFTVDVDYGQIPLVGNDFGIAKFIKKDPFLNYQPVDIIDIGVDKRGTKSIELTSNNTELRENIVSLVDLDFNRFRFRLVDGLNIETLALNYGWIYEAEISDAVIGLNDGRLTWYKGTWECGRWFGGRWLSGTWVSGDWYDGIWDSRNIKDNWINVEVDDTSNLTSSTWLNGRWFNGSWNNGTWVNGRWYDGTWENGRWFNGIWNDGIWNNGRFTGGIWVLGTWNSGIFNSENGPANWLDGTWNSGDFENGTWYNGIFDEKNGESRFGIKSYNSRLSKWYSGKWVNGSLHSRLNLDMSGSYDVSNVHKYTIWYTGSWLNGNWYGGIAYNIDFKSGIWYGGILEDIKVIGFNQTIDFDNEIVIDGIFKFNTGDVITIIDDDSNNYPSVGSNTTPGKYTILYYVEDLVNNKTKVYVDSNFNLNISDTNTGLKIVSVFRNCNWKSGIWSNGVYEAGFWEGGIWYNGIFNATWM